MRRPAEDRGPSGDHTRSALVSLAAETGLTLDELERLADRGELRALVQEVVNNNGLVDRPRWKARAGKRSPQRLLIELYAKRWPRQPISGRQALAEIMGKRWPKDGSAQ